jgi:hypothetical protein
LLGLNETVHSKEDDNRSVDILGKEYGKRYSLVISRAIFFPLFLHDLLQNYSDENITNSDPCSNGWAREISLDKYVVPIFAILLPISKHDLQSFLSVFFKHVLAIAIHLAEFVFIWL